MVQEEAEATAGLENTTSNVTVEDSAPMPVEDPGTVPMTSHEETAPITIPESLPPPPPPKRMRRGTDIDFLREELLRVEIEKSGSEVVPGSYCPGWYSHIMQGDVMVSFEVLQSILHQRHLPLHCHVVENNAGTCYNSCPVWLHIDAC
ncbi:unnamed protein product [Boreogadus saida]